MLAKELHLNTVAEGVEHYEDFKFLTDLEVDLVQGYFFAKPMTSDQVTLWVQKELNPIRKLVLG